MPGGGIWTVQNKQRPGAYINFKSVPKPVGRLGDRGTVTAALPMSWGPEGKLIELYGTDLLDGKSLAKVGCTAFDDSSLPFRMLLSGCYKALVYRANTGGDKASMQLVATAGSEVSVFAKYSGIVGNKLSVIIAADKPVAGQSTIQVLFDGKLQESIIVDTNDAQGLPNVVSEWISFTVGDGATTVPSTAGATLTGGLDGNVTADFSEYFNLITAKANWQCMVIQSTDAGLPALISAKIKSLRQELGRKVQAVVYNNNSADDEGIISPKGQGFKTATETITSELFMLWVASITAGSAVNQSNTARVIEGATEIIGYIPENEIADNLKQGWFIITYRQDGAVCVEQDINTFRSFTPDKNYAFSKNRAVRCLDEIGNRTALTFNVNYAGKEDNNKTGRNTYKGELISMLDDMYDIGAIDEFDSADVIVLPGEQIDAVVVDMYIQPVDSMEKLYMTVNVNA